MSSKTGIGSERQVMGEVGKTSSQRRGRPLWQYLSLGLALAVVPVALVATGLLLAQARQERVKLERALSNTAQTLSLAADREVRSYVVLLSTLAQSRALDEGDLPRFHAVASRVASQNNAAFVSLFSADGRQLLNTARPYGSPLPQPFLLPPAVKAPADEPPLGDVSSLRRVLATGQPTNSNLFRSLATGKLLITVDVPIRREGGVDYVMNIGLEAAALQVLLHAPSGSGDTVGAIIDANDFIVARRDARTDLIGVLANADYRAARAGAPNFVTTGSSRDGRPIMFAAHTSIYTGWTSVASVEAEHLDAEVRRIWLVGALITSAGLLVGVGLAYYLGKRINASLKSLVDVASGGDGPSPDAIDAEEIIALRSALLRARATEREAAQERERLAAARARQIELEQVATDKDRFIATLSHELRNPLGVMRNAIALLRLGGSPDKALTILERQTDHLIRLIDDLLDLSRLGQDKIRLVLETLDLRSVMAESSELVEPRMARRAQTLSIEQPDQELRVAGDRVRLRQVIANLLDNASKFSPERSHIRVQLVRGDRVASLIVRDQGPGIDAAHLETIFEPFVQLPDPRIHATDGLGLGLPLARQLIELHGGSIRVGNAPDGTGCEVKLDLPLADASPSA